MEAIGRLAGGIAHDFNNLLTAMIRLYGHSSGTSLPREHPHQDRLTLIARAAERACSIDTAVACLQAGSKCWRCQVLDLNIVVDGLKDMLRRLIGEDIELVTVLAPSTGTVQADPGQIEQILMNLAVNARDAMPTGGKVTIKTDCVTLDQDYVSTHPEASPGDYVKLSVSDTGRGMDEQTLSRIFDPFFTTKEKGVGTGLGLSTVYGIVRQHQGHVAAHSTPGHGSVFEVLFPLCQESVRTVGERFQASVTSEGDRDNPGGGR